MGLGTNGNATSYGIHPTEDAGSIGQPQSRGCIRMWPEDAETLFRLCPIGTPVRIR
jgi:lipoprotein-anchoring transpeptidase ErfK/SrfK